MGYAAAIGEASCSSEVSGVLLDRLVDDGAAAEPATGLYYASGHAKPSAAAVKKAISNAKAKNKNANIRNDIVVDLLRNSTRFQLRSLQSTADMTSIRL